MKFSLAERVPLPVVLLIVVGAFSSFVIKYVVEKTISSQFDRYLKEINLKLEKRSNFEEKILLDRYTVLRDLQTRIGLVMTDLNSRWREIKSQ